MTNKYDLAQAERFKIFRKKYIENNSAIAAKMLGIPQSRISGIENGKFPIGQPLIKLLEQKFNLNKYWLLDNIGNPIKKDQTKKTGLMTSIEMGDRIDKMATEVRILTINLEKAWGMIEAQGREIERLKKG